MSPIDVVLVTDRLSEGVSYVVSATNLVAASGNIQNNTVTVLFSGRSTKLDKVLSGMPILYDTDPDSVVRQVLTAIHREDNKIGGVSNTVSEATPPGNFVWSGTFPFLATSSADLQTYLGVTGVISPLLPTASHLWQAEAKPSLDVGVLATTDFDLDPGGSAPTVTTDADFGKGVRNVLDQTTVSDLMVSDTAAAIPNPSDGTESFIIGGVMRWDSLPGGDPFFQVVSKFNAGLTRGFLVFVAPTGGDARKLRVQFIRDPGFTLTDLTSPVEVPLGTAFAWIINVDLAADKLKIMTSEVGSYAETTINGDGTFDPGAVPFHVGQTTIAGVGSSTFVGPWAQTFSLEYSSSLDAEISAENMTQFLKYCDGFLAI